MASGLRGALMVCGTTSNAGKTTLASLLYRFYEPQSGCILIDGVPIRAIRRQSLREQIGLVPQEPILFNGTVRENIRYGRLDATDTMPSVVPSSAVSGWPA